MTISTSIGRRFTVGEIVTTAFRLAGQLEMSQTPSTPQMSFGRTLLEMIIDKLEVFHVSARATQFVTVSMVDGTNVYELTSETVDVLNPAKYIPAGEDLEHPTSESYVSVISREQWQGISARAAEGPPTMLYAHKEVDEISIYLWPTPTEAGTLRLLTGRRLADVDTDAATIDLETYWNEYLIYKLAEQVVEASTGDKEKIIRLGGIASTHLKEARARATQQLDTQISIDHDVGWR